MEKRESNYMLKGIGVSPGIIIGKVFLFTPSAVEVSTITLATDAEINHEINRFRLSLQKSKDQLLVVKIVP